MYKNKKIHIYFGLKIVPKQRNLLAQYSSHKSGEDLYFEDSVKTSPLTPRSLKDPQVFPYKQKKKSSPSE